MIVVETESDSGSDFAFAALVMDGAIFNRKSVRIQAGWPAAEERTFIAQPSGMNSRCASRWTLLIGRSAIISKWKLDQLNAVVETE